MATISSSAVAPTLTATPAVKRLTPLSSSTSTFFSYKISNHAGLGLALNRPRRVHTNRNRGMSCNALFGLGVPELVVIAGVTALVFGPKKLPEVGRSLGKTLKSFQQAAKEFETELKKDGEAPGEKITTAEEEKEEEEKQQAKV